jgi:hypothetical protein
LKFNTSRLSAPKIKRSEIGQPDGGWIALRSSSSPAVKEHRSLLVSRMRRGRRIGAASGDFNFEVPRHAHAAPLLVSSNVE